MRATDREEPRSTCLAAAPIQEHALRSNTFVDSIALEILGPTANRQAEIARPTRRGPDR